MLMLAGLRMRVLLPMQEGSPQVKWAIHDYRDAQGESCGEVHVNNCYSTGNRQPASFRSADEPLSQRFRGNPAHLRSQVEHSTLTLGGLSGITSFARWIRTSMTTVNPSS
jgi:hypothetical protein